MSDTLDWNSQTIAEFRANEGRVGGTFEGAPIVLLHHRGRKSGREYVTPTMYLPHETDQDIIYVFATKGGAPSDPDWYHNLTATGDGSVERGTETYEVTVRDLTGTERDRIYAEQARRYPGFADYERQTVGVRTIPVLELTRAQPKGSLSSGGGARTHNLRIDSPKRTTPLTCRAGAKQPLTCSYVCTPRPTFPTLLGTPRDQRGTGPRHAAGAAP
jgi:deazaflavin-dependent oxidoreductase (nitroreductase family)